MARAFALHAKGPGFESPPAHLLSRVLDAGYLVAAAVTAPIWMRKARGDWPARFGKGDPLPEDKPGQRVLVHAVSVGEVNALRTLVPLLAERVDVVVSVGTDTGIARARSLYSEIATVVRYPLDASWAVRRFLDRVRPDAVLLVELELWPNFIRACGRRGVPIGVINGRLSARSFKGYRKARFAVGGMFRSLAFAAVQDEEYAQRFEAMGVPASRVLVTGSMKWDIACAGAGVPAEMAVEAEALASAMGIDRSRPVVVAGSTGPGEEALLAGALAGAAGGDVQLVCAPRKPERFDEAAAAMPGCVRRSTGQRAEAGASHYLLDTIGELRSAYALADVVVVGRSFFDMHGSDPIEPASLGKAVVIGPAVGDFTSVVATLESGGGLVRADRDSIGGVVAGLLADVARRDRLAAAAVACVRAQQGASARHAELAMGLVAGS